MAVAAMVLSNTVYLNAPSERSASTASRQMTRFCRTCHPHINLTGDYVWRANKRVVKGRFRPMRKPQDSISGLFTANFEAQRALFSVFVVTP
jgi:hypothetical protein